MRTVFSPITDTLKHWELGGGLEAHWDLWNCGDDHLITAYFNGYATHLFKNCQQRTFDLLDNGCWSRYLLLKEFNAAGQYEGNLISAADYTTRNVDVSIGVQGEAVLQFIYRHCGWDAALGYNVYGRSHEKLCLRDRKDNLRNGNSVGIRGCNGTCAREFVVGQGLTGQDVSLSSTSNNATIRSCGTVDNPFPLGDASVEGDTVGLAYNSPSEPHTPSSDLIVAEDSAIGGNADPVTLTAGRLDRRSGEAPSYVAHKLFGYVNYTIADCDYSPFVGVGGEVTWGNSKRCCSLSKWGVWLKGGVSF